MVRISACALVRHSRRRPTSRCAPIGRASRTAGFCWSGRREARRMKRLTLMRHAGARWNDPAITDLERPLHRRGTAAAQDLARRLRDMDAVAALDPAMWAAGTQAA